MATRTVFSDNNDNEMDCYLNDKGQVFVGIRQVNEDIAHNGFITLEKEDVTELIKMLTELEKEMD